MASNKQSFIKCALCDQRIDDDYCTAPNGSKICISCVNFIGGIACLASLQTGSKPLAKNTMQTPQMIKEQLDRYVIGQDKAKRVLAVAVYNHYARLRISQLHELDKKRVVPNKSNIMLLGPTGVGKTYLVRTLAKIMDVPCAITDATGLTQAGYVGEDVESVLARLYEAANGDISRAERGIIYIDEIDKIARAPENTSITRDVGGEGVQQSLLKMLEGSVVTMPSYGRRRNPEDPGIPINTENILFICGGAFNGISTIVKKRQGKISLAGTKTIGFCNGAEAESLFSYADITSEDVVNFGMIPEFMGRFPVIAPLEEMTIESLSRILVEPENALVRQYQSLFEDSGVKLTFEDKAIRLIAEKAIAMKSGARSLRSIMENVLSDLMFEIPSDKTITGVKITEEYVRGSGDPVTERRPGKKGMRKTDSAVCEGA